MGKIIKVRVLIDSEEDVFRDIEVREVQNFEDLHKTILESFGYPNDQMASFYMSNEDWDRGEEIPLSDMGEEFGPDKRTIMRDTQIGEKLKEKSQKLLYVYDFLLMWCFYIEIVSIKEAVVGTTYPQVTLKYGNAPDITDKEEPDFMGDDDSGYSDEDMQGFDHYDDEFRS